MGLPIPMPFQAADEIDFADFVLALMAFEQGFKKHVAGGKFGEGFVVADFDQRTDGALIKGELAGDGL